MTKAPRKHVKMSVIYIFVTLQARYIMPSLALLVAKISLQEYASYIYNKFLHSMGRSNRHVINTITYITPRKIIIEFYRPRSSDTRISSRKRRGSLFRNCLAGRSGVQRLDIITAAYRRKIIMAMHLARKSCTISTILHSWTLFLFLRENELGFLLSRDTPPFENYKFSALKYYYR